MSETLKIRALDAGMVTSYPVTVLPQESGFSRRLFNVDFGGLAGLLKKRPGTQLILGNATSPIFGMFEYIRTDTGVSHKVSAWGNNLYRWDGATWVSIRSGLTGLVYDFETFANRLAVCNGADASFLWDGTTVTTPADFPKAQFLAEFRLRLLAAGDPADPLMFYASHPGDPTVWNPVAVGSRAFRAHVSPDDGQRITALVSLDDVVVVGKERSIYLLSGTTLESFSFFPVDKAIGIGSHKATSVIKNVVYFPDSEGNIYQLSPGSYPEKISAPIENMLKSVDSSKIADARSFVYNGNQYIVTLPLTIGAITLCYDTERGRWYQWDVLVGEYMWVSEDAAGHIYFCEPGGTSFKRLTLGLLTDNNTAGIEFAVDSTELVFDDPMRDKEIATLFLGFQLTDKMTPVDVFCSLNNSTWEHLSTFSLTGTNPGHYKVVSIPVGTVAKGFAFSVRNSVPGCDIILLNAQLTYHKAVIE